MANNKVLTASNLAPFVGAKVFSDSLDFYVAVGWEIGFQHDDLAELILGETTFYLQNAYEKNWCENLMIYLTVSDAAAWYEQVSGVLSQRNFGLARVKEPTSEAHAKSVTYMWDPCGVLWQLAEP